MWIPAFQQHLSPCDIHSYELKVVSSAIGDFEVPPLRTGLKLGQVSESDVAKVSFLAQ